MGLELQKECYLQIQKNSERQYILGLEHPQVVTLGKRGEVSKDILVPLESLDDLGFQYYEVDRGGHATLHNPGQLVIYPLLSLDVSGMTVREYVCKLTQTTQKLLLNHGVQTSTKDKSPGLYTQNGKIAFFGVRVSRGITSHGVSINISNNLEDFSLIKSCGNSQETFDRVTNHINFEISSENHLQKLFSEWCELFFVSNNCTSL